MLKLFAATAALCVTLSYASDAHARCAQNAVISFDRHSAGEQYSYGTSCGTKVASGKQTARTASKPQHARPAIASAPLVDRARQYIGMTASQIGLRRTTLWCAAFMNHITGGGTGSDLAKSYTKYGQRISGPQVGAIAVLSRGRRGGHVGVVSGIDAAGNPIIISGNHNRRVGEAVYSKSRVLAYVVGG